MLPDNVTKRSYLERINDFACQNGFAGNTCKSLGRFCHASVTLNSWLEFERKKHNREPKQPIATQNASHATYVRSCPLFHPTRE